MGRRRRAVRLPRAPPVAPPRRGRPCRRRRWCRTPSSHTCRANSGGQPDQINQGNAGQRRATQGRKERGRQKRRSTPPTNHLPHPTRTRTLHTHASVHPQPAPPEPTTGSLQLAPRVSGITHTHPSPPRTTAVRGIRSRLGGATYPCETHARPPCLRPKTVSMKANSSGGTGALLRPKRVGGWCGMVRRARQKTLVCGGGAGARLRQSTEKVC